MLGGGDGYIVIRAHVDVGARAAGGRAGHARLRGRLAAGLRWGLTRHVPPHQQYLHICTGTRVPTNFVDCDTRLVYLRNKIYVLMLI